jgi:hypothetical protein
MRTTARRRSNSESTGAEVVEGPHSLVESSLDVGKRKVGKEAETVREGSNHIGNEVVDRASHGPGFGVVAEMRAGR